MHSLPDYQHPPPKQQIYYNYWTYTDASLSPIVYIAVHSWCCAIYEFGQMYNNNHHSTIAAAAAAKLLHSYPTLCDPIDSSPPGSSVPGILQVRILEWVASFFSSARMLSRFSHVRLCATLWTAAHQAPLYSGFSRQEYWSGLPIPSPYSTTQHPKNLLPFFPSETVFFVFCDTVNT